MQYDTTYYPALNDMKLEEEILEKCIPYSLTLFINTIVKSKIKQTTIATTIEIDHVFGSKWLINQLARLGLSLSADELTRFKQSVLAEDRLIENNCPPLQGFMSWVADNVDHNVVTLDEK